MYRGDTVALKEIEIGRSPAMQQAFLQGAWRMACSSARAGALPPACTTLRQVFLRLSAGRGRLTSMLHFPPPPPEAMRLQLLRHPNVVRRATVVPLHIPAASARSAGSAGGALPVGCWRTDAWLACHAPARLQVSFFGVALEGSKGKLVLEFAAGEPRSSVTQS